MIPSCSLLPKAAAGGGGGGGGGGGSPTISLSNDSTTANSVRPSNALAFYSVNADGTVSDTAGFFENWISDPSQAGNYEVKAVLSSGTTPTGTLGSYLALTSNRLWTVNQTVVGTSSCTLTVTIRKTGTTTVLATATITMTATETF